MMIDADLDFSRYDLAAAIEFTVCITSVRNDFSQVSGVSPTASALTLQTTVSMPPSFAAALSTHPLSAAASATSIASPHDLTPLAASAFTTFPTSSALRAQIATLAPSSAKSSAIASPMPLLLPVTSTFFPFSPRSMAASSGGRGATSLFGHDLFGKPLHTFPDHALSHHGRVGYILVQSPAPSKAA